MRNTLFLLLSMMIFCRLSAADQMGSTADTNRVFLQCSNTSADSKVVEECVDLLFEEAEVRLQKIEREWKFFGDAEVQAASTATAGAERPKIVEGVDDRALAGTNEPDANQSGVISIVNDQALQSGAVPGGTLVNIDDAGDETPDSKPDESGKANSQADAATIAASERFRFLPALFRSYRDQHCAWQATLFGEDRRAAYHGACLTAMTQSRALALHASLAEVRAISARGKTYKGFYVKTDSGATFQACDRTNDWWVIVTDDAGVQLDARAELLNMNIADIAYAEVGGRIKGPPATAIAAGYRQALQIESVNLLRSVTPSDCVGSQVVLKAQTEVPLTDAANDSVSTTVEDLASAGFLYGFFNQWVSACAVTDTSVCSAETEAVYATEGDWVIKLDRSVARDWRVRLIPTTDDHRIDNRYVVSIDDLEVFLGTEDRSSVVIPMNEGIDIASGEIARELIVKLRAGQKMQIVWQQADTGSHELSFSLLGVTAALRFFDQQEP